MHHEHGTHRIGLALGLEGVQLDIERAASGLHQVFVLAVRLRDQLVARGEDLRFGSVVILHLEQLHLPDHQRLGDLRGDAAARSQQLRCVAGRREHRGLLDRHRDQTILIVDLEVHAESQRHAQDPQRVLHHSIGVLIAEARLTGEHLELRFAQPRNLRDARASLAHRQSIEPG